MAMNSEPLIPVTVLTGFLGSGKTTILSRILRDPAFEDTAVIVNEFGEVGLDHLLVESSDESIVDLSCGCICCTIRGDLMATLIDLYERREAGEIRRFKRVVVETTGLADPAPIIHTLMQEPLVFNHYRLARVVTAVDAVNAMSTFDRQPEAIKQAAVADALLITKTDMANHAEALSALDSRLGQLNPSAVHGRCIDGAVDPAMLFSGGIYDPAGKSADVEGWLEAESTAGTHNHATDVSRHGDGIFTYALMRDAPVSRAALSAFMQMLADQRGDDLLRLKGFVRLTDDPSRPAVVHGVQHVIHPIRRLDAWPEGADSTSVVFIVRGIDQGWVENLFDRVAESAYADLDV
ncbi:MAG: GTP-binding protein [Rhodospirillaceae bacterium]|nr:GTP-binding protein [Rhodospirillaceae bacterium]